MNAFELAPILDVGARDLPEVGWSRSLFTWLAGTLDAAALEGMAIVVDSMMMPAAEDLPTLLASALPFVSGPLVESPRDFFDFQQTTWVEEEARPRRRLAGGRVVSRRFRTSYRPSAFAAAVRDAAELAADRLLVEHWTRDPQRPLGTVIALHGFTMGTPRIDAVALFANAMYRRGLDVALVTLPFHGKRTPRGARFSGEHFAFPDIGRLNDAVRQAVYEITGLVARLREESDAPVGVLGLSLGGYLAGLMGGLDGTLDFVVPMVPPVCFGDLAWRFFSRSRRRPQTASFSLEDLRRCYRVHSPLTYPLAVSRERTFIVAGRGDQIVPAAHPHALWRHWGQPRIHWFSGSHLAPFGRAQLISAVLDHIERCCRP